MRMSDGAQRISLPISLVKSRQRCPRSSISGCARVQAGYSHYTTGIIIIIVTVIIITVIIVGGGGVVISGKNIHF